MTLSHREAQKYLNRELDGSLSAAQRARLTNHLEHCAQCRAYADQIRSLDAHLSSDFQTRYPLPPFTSSEISQRIAAAQETIHATRLSANLIGALRILTWASVMLLLVLGLIWSLNNLTPQPALSTPVAASPTLTSPIPFLTESSRDSVSTPTPAPPIPTSHLPTPGSQADGPSQAAVISSGWRYVAFASLASNLVGQDTNQTWDIFVYDREENLITRVSTATDGSQGDAMSDGPSLSADGRYAAFVSWSTNFPIAYPDECRGPSGSPPICVGVYVHDRLSSVTQLIDLIPDRSPRGQPI